MNQDKLYHMYTSPWTEVVMYEPGQTWSHVHLIMNWSSNVWTRTNFITCVFIHYYFSSWWGVHVFIHYYFSSWWGVHVIKFVLVHTLLLLFMVRCTCDQVCPGSCITTSVHGEVYMWSSLSWFMHYYFSSWWGVEVVMYEPGQTWSHVHLTMNWSSNVWTRTNFITCTPHHEQK
jgi:hypothetical protein